MFRGVCAALGRATGTDPVLWRVVVVVLAVLGGSGIVLYLAGWLLVPDEGSAESALQRGLRGGSTPATVAVVVVGIVALLVLVGDGAGLATLVVLGVIAYLVVRQRQQSAPSGAAGWSSPPSWTAPAETGPGWGPAPGAAWQAETPPPVPPPPSPRSPLGLITSSAVVLVVGGLLLAAALGLDGVTATRVLAAALIVTGAGLLVGAIWGRSRGLIVLAVVLALALAAATGVDRSFGTSAGERTWEVAGSVEHRLGAGAAVLDLRPLSGTAGRDVVVRGQVGLGELVVLVPEDLRMELSPRVGLGELTLVEPDGETQAQDGPGLGDDVEIGPSEARNVRLDVRVGLGELEVRRVAAR